MVLFYLILIILSIIHIECYLESCRQKFGSHKYDLNQLSDFTIFGSDDEFRYALTPCGLVPTNQCGKNTVPFDPGMTACQERVSGGRFESSMGFLDGYNKLPNLEFSENPQGPGTGVVMIVRNAKCNLQERFVQITFICDKSIKKPTRMDVVETMCRFKITVRAVGACPLEGSMPGGAVFIIILFVGIIIYLLGGIFYNRYKRNQTGLAVLPHLSFWLLISGYFINGCKETWTFIRSYRSNTSPSSAKYESI